MQLTGDPGCVPPDVRLELPFALVEPQLASGRVTVTAKVFEVSMPVSFRGLFQAGPGAVDVSLPLQEVLKNLPTTSLRMRDDQEEQDAGENFATPFSAKAEEDAKRFNVPATPVAKPVVLDPIVEATKPAEAETAEADVDNVAESATAMKSLPSAHCALRSRSRSIPTRNSTRKRWCALVNKIPGVKACAIVFGDGLSLAGSLPAELETEGLCAMAPSLMQRVENHLVDAKLGQLRGMTLSCTKGQPSHSICTKIFASPRCMQLADLPGDSREKLSRIVHETFPKIFSPRLRRAHVDHQLRKPRDSVQNRLLRAGALRKNDEPGLHPPPD